MFGNQRCVSVTTVLFFTFLAVVGECQGVDARDGDTAAPLPRDAQGQLRVVFDGGSTDAHRVNHLRLLSNAFVENEAFEIVEANAGVGGGHGGKELGSDTDTVDVASEKQIGKTEVANANREISFDVAWDFQPDDTPVELNPGQRANHFPGVYALTSKAFFGTLGLKSTPSTLVPRWSTADEIISEVRNVLGDEEDYVSSASNNWLVKSATHGDVRVLRNGAHGEARVTQEKTLTDSIQRELNADNVVQRRITNPLRVDGHAFDCGVYVLVNGEKDGTRSSWEAYVFDETLLRFVGDESVDDLLGKKYPGAWDVETLKELGAGGDDSKSSDAPVNWNALGAYLELTFGKGTSSHVRESMHDSITHALNAASPFVAQEIHSKGTEQFPDGASHFVELLRFDFVIDDGSGDRGNSTGTTGQPFLSTPKPWLIEVNASPNLHPASKLQERVLRRLCARVTNALLFWSRTKANRNEAYSIDNDNVFTKLPLYDDGELFVDDTTRNNFRRTLKYHRDEPDVDCVLTAWGDWGACNGGSCGDGKRTRSRSMTTQQAEHGSACPDEGVLTETEQCSTICSPPPPTSEPSPPPPHPSPPLKPSPPPPPPPTSSRVFDVDIELVSVETFDEAAQTTTAQVVFENLVASTSTETETEPDVTNVDVVSYGYMARTEVTLANVSADDKDEDNLWVTAASVLSLNTDTAPTNIVLGIDRHNASVSTVEVNVLKVGSAGDDVAESLRESALNATSEFSIALNSAGYSILSAMEIGTVTSTTLRITVATVGDVTRLDQFVVVTKNALTSRIKSGAVAGNLTANSVRVSSVSESYDERFAETFVGIQSQAALDTESYSRALRRRVGPFLAVTCAAAVLVVSQS